MSSISVRFHSFSSLIRFSMIISRVSTVVGLDGFEPSTSRLSGARSNHLSYKPFSFGWFFPSSIGWWESEPTCAFSFRQISLLSRRRALFQFRRNWSGFDWHILSDKIISPTKGRCYDFGGDDGNRTHDPLLAGQVLSQLSYTPIFGFYPSG